jgi:hypothetical protein
MNTKYLLLNGCNDDVAEVPSYLYSYFFIGLLTHITCQISCTVELFSEERSICDTRRNTRSSSYSYKTLTFLSKLNKQIYVIGISDLKEMYLWPLNISRLQTALPYRTTLA